MIKERYNITLDRNKVKIQSTKFFDSESQAAAIVKKAIVALNKIKYTSLQLLSIEESIPNIEYIVTIRNLESKKEADFILNRAFFNDGSYYDRPDIAKSSLNALDKVVLRIAYHIYRYFITL
jgi:hypothetical protein